jgi:hypothetical protein
VADVPACGTRAAVRRHERRHEQLDEACLESRRAHDRARYANDPVRRETVKAAARAASRAKGHAELGTLPQRACGLCEGLFTPANARARYCSPHCWELDNRTTKLVAELRMLDPDARRVRIDQLAARRQRAEVEAGRYGPAHQAERRRRLDERAPDERCARCRELLPEDEAGIDLDHDDDDPTRYLGLSHSRCNRGKRPIAELLAS